MSRHISILLLLVLTIILTACGSDSSAPATQDTSVKKMAFGESELYDPVNNPAGQILQPGQTGILMLEAAGSAAQSGDTAGGGVDEIWVETGIGGPVQLAIDDFTILASVDLLDSSGQSLLHVDQASSTAQTSVGPGKYLLRVASTHHKADPVALFVRLPEEKTAARTTNKTVANDADYFRLLNTGFCCYCDLRYVRLDNMQLGSVNLYGANLTGANLSYADLTGARLDSANLTSANLTGAGLIDANLTNAILTGATWFDGAVCKDGSIGGCILHKIEMQLSHIDDDIYLYETNAGGSGLADISQMTRVLYQSGGNASYNLVNDIGPEGERTYVLKLGNGGCFGTSLSMQVNIDDQPVYSGEFSRWTSDCGWQLEHRVTVNKFTGAVTVIKDDGQLNLKYY